MTNLVKSDLTMNSSFSRRNNFDLIRLFASLQVVCVHLIEHFNVGSLNWLIQILAIFPGVPIFFFVSGFLISASWERNPVFQRFVKNRILRTFLVSGGLFCLV